MNSFWTSKDFLAGAIFGAIGVVAMAIAQDYGMGSLTRMGSGYFPVLLGAVISVLGGLMMLRAGVDAGSREPVGPLAIRPAVFVIGAVAAFGLLVERAGFVAAIAALTVVAWAAGSESRGRELIGLVAVLNLIAVAIFVWALDMPIRLGPR